MYLTNYLNLDVRGTFKKLWFDSSHINYNMQICGVQTLLWQQIFCPLLECVFKCYAKHSGLKITPESLEIWMYEKYLVSSKCVYPKSKCVACAQNWFIRHMCFNLYVTFWKLIQKPLSLFLYIVSHLSQCIKDLRLNVVFVASVSASPLTNSGKLYCAISPG